MKLCSSQAVGQDCVGVAQPWCVPNQLWNRLPNRQHTCSFCGQRTCSPDQHPLSQPTHRCKKTQTQAWHLRHMVTPVKRMLPARLGVFKRAIYALATGYRPTAATATFTASTSSSSSSTAPASSSTAAVADAVAANAATPSAFVDVTVADVVADIETRSRAPLGLPPLPAPKRLPGSGSQQQQEKQQQQGFDKNQKASAPGSSNNARQQGLAERRAKKGLRPGQLDPAATAAAGVAVDRRSKELLERKSYLRNFWYCVGE